MSPTNGPRIESGSNAYELRIRQTSTLENDISSPKVNIQSPQKYFVWFDVLVEIWFKESYSVREK